MLSFLQAGLCLFAWLILTLPAAAQKPGPSSKRTPLVITEIMYNPSPSSGGANLEFIEIYNSDIASVDISNFRLLGDVQFTFPSNTVAAAQSYLVVAAQPEQMRLRVPATVRVLGGLQTATNALPNDQGTIQLRNRSGAVLLEVTYSDDPPWPAAADGAGHSLVLHRPSLGERFAEAWRASVWPGGSPGTAEPRNDNPLSAIKINEILAHTDDPEVDYIELFNATNITIDISGVILTDDPALNKYAVPSGTTIPAGGFYAINQEQLNFALSAQGETVYLKTPTENHVLDAIKFPGQENGISSGRFPDGADQWHRLSRKSPGARNDRPRQENVVINELMYHPISNDDEEQYVELFNSTDRAIDLSGWRLSDAIDFTFPANSFIPAQGFIVVARNRTTLLEKNPTLPQAAIVGNYSGKLSGRTERVVLLKPDTLLATNSTGRVSTNTFHIPVDEVRYSSGGRWASLADGGGSSLELVDWRANHRLAQNWASSDETTTAQWMTVEHTGILDNGTGSADSLQIFLQGSGECLVDNVQVLDASGQNLILNSGFEAGMTGWVAEGTQSASSVVDGQGVNGTRALHVRAAERGDNTMNRIRVTLTTPLASGTRATIRARVRWLSGHPEILLRLRGNYLEAFANIAPTSGLGTPGQVNSRARANTGPAIAEVEHSPVLPAANESVRVTALIDDPDGVINPTVLYRLDPATTYISRPMNDSGTGGDLRAGDGIFTATIPGQTAGGLVAFYVQAEDNSSARIAHRFPNNAPAREGLIRWGETRPAGPLGTYRLWITQATFNRWTSRHKLDNTPLDVTFVYNDERVIYNMQALYAGSPYISPGYNTPSGNLAGYTGEFPKDEPFLGTTDFVLDWPGRDATALQEQAAYWIAHEIGLPSSHRRFIRLHVNGVTETQRGSIYEDVQQPGREMIRQWFPENSEGELFKIEKWFEFADGGSFSAIKPSLEVFTTTSLETGETILKPARYRWSWLPRAADSMNNLTNLLGLVQAINAPQPEPYRSHLEAMVDIDEWMGIFAVEHIVNNFDSYGHNIGKNMYAYKPDDDKWQMLMFDIDWVMLASRQLGYDTTSSLFASEDPVISRMYNFPAFRRAYFRAVEQAATGPMAPQRINAWLDERHAALRAAGVTSSAGQALAAPTEVKTWIEARRAYLLEQLAPVNAAFAINSPSSTAFTSTTNVLTISGTAPVKVKGFRVNGVEWQVEWPSVTEWRLRVALKPGVNQLALQPYDANDRAIADLARTLQVTYQGPSPNPEDQVIINEIHFQPRNPAGEFVELYNNSSSNVFDLSGWRLNGADFTFPGGTLLSPNSYVVVARDRTAFFQQFGASIAIAAEFDGKLDDSGETLSLIEPGSSNVVDLVSYEVNAPWPVSAAGTGSSLQVIDPAQENFRASNWGVRTNGSGAVAPEWQYVTFTGSATTARLYIYLTSAGQVHIDDLKLVAGSIPEAGPNLIPNGSFEESFPGSWTVSANLAGSATTTAVKKEGNQSLRIVSTSPGSSQSSSLWMDVPGVTLSETYTLSYWYLPSTNGSGLTIRLSGNGINSTHPIAPQQNFSLIATPGRANSVRATVPALADVWLNELVVRNENGITDGSGEREPWVELYNSGTQPISLTGFYLTDSASQLAKWAFPAGTSIAAGGYLMVWLDGETAESSSTALHTNFRISATNGFLALVQQQNASFKVVDYLIFENPVADASIGFLPNQLPGLRQWMASPTPGSSNTLHGPVHQLFINEWMASASSPAAGLTSTEDWFEIYNPNNFTVELGGYKIGDAQSRTNPMTIPVGTRIPARGFLLVWADDLAIANTNNSSALHVNFKLSRDGDDLVLFSPNGQVVDQVRFLRQETDVSEGRLPDGSAQIQKLTSATPGRSNGSGGTAETITINALVVDAGQVQLEWSSTTGVAYVVEFTTDLGSGTWQAAGTVTATSGRSSLTHAAADPHRFYRIRRQNP